MKVMKISKPNAALKEVIRQNKLNLYSVKMTETVLKLVYRNEEDKKSLRLQIETLIPSHLNEELLKSLKLVDFETVGVTRYMGYTTMKCRKITFADSDGDVFSLEVI